MRERLLAAFVGLALLTTLLYGVPRAFIVADQTRASETRSLERQADAVVASVDTTDRLGIEPDLVSLTAGLAGDEGLRYHPAAGQEVAAGVPFAPGDLTAVRTSRAGGTLEVWRERGAVDRRVATAIVPILVVGLGVLAVGVVLAWVLSRRFARPLQQLATAAEELGEGRFDLEVPEQDIREAAAIARALRTSAARIARQLRQEQEFSSSASHQLRTPLTGLRLRLEGLLDEPDLRGDAQRELRAAIAEVDRLTATVADLLQMARTSTVDAGPPVRLDELVLEVADRWASAAADEGRTVAVVASDPVAVAASSSVLAQVLDVLVDNALCHGTGDVAISVAAEDRPVRVRVQDGGPGIAPDLASRIFERHVSRPGSTGEGIGLALARQLVEAVGGRLRLAPGAPTTFDVLLPSTSVVG
jgi:signal transduction histidine kinase